MRLSYILRLPPRCSFLEDDRISELEGKSEEIFAEGLAELAEGQEVTTSGRETEMWSKYLAWCEERYRDKNVSETMREKVSICVCKCSLNPPPIHTHTHTQQWLITTECTLLSNITFACKKTIFMAKACRLCYTIKVSMTTLQHIILWSLFGI